MTWFDVKNVLQSADVYFLRSFAFFLWMSFYFSIVSDRSLNRWLRDSILSEFAKMLNRNRCKLYWQLGNWMFFCQANEISSSVRWLFLNTISKWSMELTYKERVHKRIGKDINKWILDGDWIVYTWRKIEIKNYVMREIASQSDVHEWQTFHSSRRMSQLSHTRRRTHQRKKCEFRKALHKSSIKLAKNFERKKESGK